MSSFQILEDQENRIPAQRRVKREDPRLKSNVQANKRPVLGAISTNHLRKQPSRVAKQGVSYETGIPLQNENANTGVSEKDAASSKWPFSIHEDSESGSTSLSVGSTNTTESIGAVGLASKHESLDKIEEVHPSVVSLQRISHDSDKENGSKEELDMSVCESDAMVIESPPREEILSRRGDDIFDVPEYAADIYKYLREAEVCHKPRANYMVKQTDITNGMRWILVDWLVEVAEEYSLQTETLYLAVSYIDRFLSHMSVKRDKLQLVGTTAMFIAAKYEEIYPPDVGQFAYITDNTYKVSQILRMEHLILKVLSFDMAVPTANVFTQHCARLINSSEETLHLALFLSELSLLDCDPFLRYLPSQISAAALALANHTKNLPVWPDVCVKHTGYTLDDLKECYINIHTVFSRVSETKQHAIREKYMAIKWNVVSSLNPRQSFPW
ncbi:cyclin A [Oratosquilla oratoria]|uniref:cyclin A n=1 Tax=Oratosquilla oratoria TaxID=337810 RepID=UPI003F7759F0